MKTMIRKILFILITLLCVCPLFAKSTANPPSISIQCDSCVLFVHPSAEQIERMKSSYENEEDFYIMADDANYYAATAFEYLDSKGVKVILLDTVRQVLFNESELCDYRDLSWDFVLYKKDSSPLIVPAIDLSYEFERYFGRAAYSTESEWNIASKMPIISASGEELADLNMTSWSNDCDGDNSVYFDTTGAQFCFSTAFTMNAVLRKFSSTMYAVYFSYPIVRPIPEEMQDCRNYAENIPVAKIEREGEQLSITWLGFFDTTKGVRVHTQNPFGINSSSVILRKCNY